MTQQPGPCTRLELPLARSDLPLAAGRRPCRELASLDEQIGAGARMPWWTHRPRPPMNKLSPLLLPVVLSAATAALVSVTVASPPPEAAGRDATFRPALDGDVLARLEAMQRAQEELAEALDAFEVRFTALELRSGRSTRESAAPEAEAVMPEGLAELAAALKSKGSAPKMFDEWLDGELEAREGAAKEKRREEVQTTLEDLLADRIDELADRLDLAPHQTTEVEGILNSHISEVSAVIAEAESPIDLMRSMGPIQADRDAQLEAVLTPEQFTTFQKEQSSFRQLAMPFGQPGR